jgi:hypothetical protein
MIKITEDWAEIMTEATSACKHGEYCNKKDLKIEYAVCSLFGDRDPLIGVIEKINGF